jgi:sugar O-acyltransferase (sialic acid O-acetyltransferase NeuD family)
MKRLAIIGSALSGGAAQIIDAVSTQSEYKVVAIFDNHEKSQGTKVLDVPVVATSNDVESHWKRGDFDEAVIAIGGDLKERQRLFDYLRSIGVPFANVVDRTAEIRTGAKIGCGNVILAKVFIGPLVSIGDNCYLITDTCINHDSKVGSHVYFSAGCVIAGDVEIGDRVRFDTASGAKARIRIRDDFNVTAGQILLESP